jgi:hypothetical protein
VWCHTHIDVLRLDASIITYVVQTYMHTYIAADVVRPRTHIDVLRLDLDSYDCDLLPPLLAEFHPKVSNVENICVHVCMHACT